MTVQQKQSFWRGRHWILWVAGGLLAVLAAAVVVVEIGLRRAEPFLRARIVEELEDHFHARVELDSFHISLVRGLWAEGEGLRIWPPADFEGVGVPAGEGKPLIALEEFRFHAPLHYVSGEPIRISLVELKGLRVDMPPRSHFEDATAMKALEGAKKPKGKMAGGVRFEVDRMECIGTEMVMETSKPGKLPLDFEIASFRLTGIGSGAPMRFEAVLTNPKPHGAIYSMGLFGPWKTNDPGQSPIEGSYDFEGANLADFKGIAGILSSTGHYEGTLRDLTVDGQTKVPDFRLTHFGNAMALSTLFHAQVDGTNGDTWLEPVDATLGRSHFSTSGEVVRVIAADAGEAPHSIGHDIDLKVNVEKGRIEDFLRLAGHTEKVLLTGDVAVKATLHIPPGPVPVHQRLKMEGNFSLDNALFTSEKVQERIAQLSARGQGKPDELKTLDPLSIVSQMDGRFQMGGGLITLPALEYTVPGAKVELNGTYTLEGGRLDFDGHAKMDASVSKMVGGWKGLLLTPADPFFKKNGAGTEVPIHITGTREAPELGIEFKKMKLGDKAEGKGQQKGGPAESQP